MDDLPSILRPFEGSRETGGRRPPANIEAERAFLGALLANNKVLDRVPFLRPQHFADPVNGRIFEVATSLIEDRKIADAVTLKTVFDEGGVLQEVGGTAYLTSLLTAMVGIINAPDYARVVADTWLRRELIDIAEILSGEAFGTAEDPVDAKDLAMRTVGMIDQVSMGIGGASNHIMTLDQAMLSALDAMEAAGKSDKPAGVSTGFSNIDYRLGGLEAGLVYVLAGRPGMGKSALGHKFALNVARGRPGKEDGQPVFEQSLEMSGMQLGRRALAVASGVALSALKTGQASQGDYEKLRAARSEMRELPLLIDETPAQTPRQIMANARAAKRKFGGRLGLVLLDHLNLTGAEDKESRHGPTHAITQASGTMLQLAKELETAVVLLVQLNRGVEGREDKRPGLADLRQSGAIEQDAYAIGFVYREEYYLLNPPERKENETGDAHASRVMAFRARQEACAGKADVIWAKIRDGEPGTDRLYFEGKTTTFSEERL